MQPNIKIINIKYVMIWKSLHIIRVAAGVHLVLFFFVTGIVERYRKIVVLFLQNLVPDENHIKYIPLVDL